MKTLCRRTYWGRFSNLVIWDLWSMPDHPTKVPSMFLKVLIFRSQDTGPTPWMVPSAGFSESLLIKKNYLTPIWQWSDILWKNTKLFCVVTPVPVLFFLAKIFWIIRFDKVQRIKHWKLEILFLLCCSVCLLVSTLKWIELEKNFKNCIIKFWMANSHYGQELCHLF